MPHPNAMARTRSALSTLEQRFWQFASLAIGGVVVAAISISFHYPWQKPLFPNSDFEYGTLEHWTAEGTAFEAQPTLGDNPLLRGRSTSNYRGQYWIGTFERRHIAQDAPGASQGDAPTGRLTSMPFTIERDHLCFLIGGGDGSPSTGVALIVDGQQVLFESGHGAASDSEKMSRVTWDVSRWKGKQATIVVEDQAIEPWGHINVDDFRYT